MLSATFEQESCNSLSRESRGARQSEHLSILHQSLCPAKRIWHAKAFTLGHLQRLSSLEA